MARILVTEKIAASGLAQLRAAGHEIDVRLDLSPDTLLDAVRGAHALIVRSATQVTAEVLAAGADLVVVGRAGIGLDNIDVVTATRRGVMVVNAPHSTTVSAAEHTMALLLAQARNLPQAHTALKAGQWERSRWEGVELHGKVLGIVGLGRVGTLVAQRALSFGMRLVAYDPYLASERAQKLGVELRTLEDLVRLADFLTIHLPKTPDTIGLIGEEILALAKPGLRIINTARGGIIDEDALAKALANGAVAGAALDVFVQEPCTSSPLFGVEQVVVTPHLGASTREAQDKAGATIAEQVQLALSGEFVPFAVNVSATEASETVRPFLPLAERLGKLFAFLNEGLPAGLDVEYQGSLADYDTRILTLAVLKGLLSADARPTDMPNEPVSYVNAPLVATARGVEVRETKSPVAQDFVNLVTVRGDEHAIAGTLAGRRGEARLVMIDDHTLEVPPAHHMLVVRNEDYPGMIGLVGTVLGEAGVNIADMGLGRSPSGEAALMLLAIDEPIPAEVLDKLRSASGILWARALG